MRGRRTIGFGAAMALALLAVAPAAQADTNLGTVDGLTYIVDYMPSTAPPAALAARAECPGGTHVVGGGASPVSFAPVTSEFSLNRSRAVDGADRNGTPDDGWIGRGYNRSGEDKSFFVYAICFADEVRYSAKEAAAPGGARIAAKAACPPHTYVAGGGASLTGSPAQAFLNTSISSDGPNSPTVHDAWRVRAWNRGGRVKHLRVVVECVKFRPAYEFQPTPDPVQRQDAHCRAGSHAMAGGGIISGAPYKGFINGIYPFAAMGPPPSRAFEFAVSTTEPGLLYGAEVVCRR